jgi:hypothetical protein
MKSQPPELPEFWQSWLALSGTIATVAYFILRPLIIFLHRMFGKEAFRAEWAQLKKTAEDVDYIRQQDLPHIKHAAEQALETTNRSEEKLDDLMRAVLRLTQQVGQLQGAQHPSQVGSYTPPKKPHE